MSDHKVPQSHNAVEAGETKAHGNTDASINRPNKTADMPPETGWEVHSGAGNVGHSSGKGGHEPKTVGQKKGTLT